MLDTFSHLLSSFITFHGDRIADQFVDIIDVKDFLIFTWLLIILRD